MLVGCRTKPYGSSRSRFLSHMRCESRHMKMLQDMFLWILWPMFCLLCLAKNNDSEVNMLIFLILSVGSAGIASHPLSMTSPITHGLASTRHGARSQNGDWTGTYWKSSSQYLTPTINQRLKKENTSAVLDGDDRVWSWEWIKPFIKSTSAIEMSETEQEYALGCDRSYTQILMYVPSKEPVCLLHGYVPQDPCWWLRSNRVHSHCNVWTMKTQLSKPNIVPKNAEASMRWYEIT